jgi:multidrug efflux pump
VESLSSFIGADGTNTTLNSGRISINLKPLDQRKLSASDVIRRLQTKLVDVKDIQLFMQPVQNITIDDRVSRTQYQYTLEDADQNELNQWSAQFVDRLKQLPELEDVATDQQLGGLAVSLVIDRVTASRLGVAPTTIDNTLYDAFGQRQINTMYTQLNQYHVVLESEPQFQQDPTCWIIFTCQSNSSASERRSGFFQFFDRFHHCRLQRPYFERALHAGCEYAHAARQRLTPTASSAASGVNFRRRHKFGFPATQCLSAPSRTSRTTTEPLSITHQGQFPAITVSFNLAPNAALGGAITAVTKVQKDMHMPRASRPIFRDSGILSQLAFEYAAADPCRAGYGLHCPRRSVRELHSSHHHSLHASFCRSWRIPLADPVSSGLERGGDHRPCTADRHRQERTAL